jgi:hypothetical protein
MNTDQLAAPGTCPPFLLLSDEQSYAELLYLHETVDHTHSILGSIALVQVIQPVAGKTFTAEAVPDVTLSYLLAVLDAASDAGFWFDAVISPAAGTCLFIPLIRPTEATVHSAGSNQRRADRVCLCRSSLCHIPISAEPCKGASALKY